MQEILPTPDNSGNGYNSKQMNAIQRIAGVLISPVETMKNLADRPRILFPFYSIPLISIIYTLLNLPILKKLFDEQIDIALSKSATPPPPEFMELMKNIGGPLLVAGSPINTLISWLIFAVAVLALVKIFKGEGTFKQFMSITGYAFVIAFVNMALSSIVAPFTGSANINTSLSIFAPGLKGSYIYGLLAGISVFNIWNYIVVGIGVHCVSKLDKSKVYKLMSILFAIFWLYEAIGLKGI